MSSLSMTLKVIGFLLVGVVGWQSYMIYDLKNLLIAQNEIANKSSMLSSSSQTDEKKEDLSTHKESSSTMKDVSSHFNDQQIDPFKEFQMMQREFDKVFERFNSHFANDPFFKVALNDFSYEPLADMSENGDEYIIKVDIPGANDSKIDTKIEDNVLIIKAQSDESKESNSSSFISKERYVNKFQKAISLPTNIDASKMKSEYKDGVLTITIPKV